MAQRKEPVVVGRFSRHVAGSGHVRPEGKRELEVFLTAEKAAGLMHGDQVEVRVLKRDFRGRRTGRVERVVEPAPRRATGVLEIRGKQAAVHPYDARVAQRIDVTPRKLAGAEDGMAVGVELLRLPAADGVATGRITEVLGHPDEPGVDLKIIVHKFDLPDRWPDEVLEESQRAAASIGPAEVERREDFRSLPTVTIDGETAKDFDDALSVEALRGGGFRLHVHIADVAHYVPPGGATDREARTRGTSVYFPGHVIPMLPERLSNELCSLCPGEDRLTHTAVMEFDSSGSVLSVRFADGIIRSAERMTYTQVAKILAGEDAPLLDRYAPLVQDFQHMETLCRLLSDRRKARGSIDFDLPVPEIVLNARGEMTGVFPSERNIAHRIVEEFMLVTNEAVAAFLASCKAPTLYRVHDAPEPLRLEALEEAISGLEYRLPHPLEAITPTDIQDLVRQSLGKPEERFIGQMVLRSMMQARYDPENRGHFGLAAERYLHFTSPIRRYPDLVVHRVLRAVRRKELPTDGPAHRSLTQELPELAAHCSSTERRAEGAERELELWKKLGFMGDKLGEEFHGFVTGVQSFGLFMQLEEHFVEGLIHISMLTDDFYDFDDRRHVLRGQSSGRVFRLGDRLEVRVVRVNHFLKQMDLELAEGATAVKGPRRPQRPAKPPRGRRKPEGRRRKRR